MPTANQRSLPTRSCSSGPASRETKSGVTNSRAVVSASGMMRKAAMAKPVTATSSAPRTACRTGRRVVTNFQRIDGARKMTIIRKWKV